MFSVPDEVLPVVENPYVPEVVPQLVGHVHGVWSTAGSAGILVASTVNKLLGGPIFIVLQLVQLSLSWSYSWFSWNLSCLNSTWAIGRSDSSWMTAGSAESFWSRSYSWFSWDLCLFKLCASAGSAGSLLPQTVILLGGPGSLSFSSLFHWFWHSPMRDKINFIWNVKRHSNEDNPNLFPRMGGLYQLLIVDELTIF